MRSFGVLFMLGHWRGLIFHHISTPSRFSCFELTKVFGLETRSTCSSCKKKLAVTLMGCSESDQNYSAYHVVSPRTVSIHFDLAHSDAFSPLGLWQRDHWHHCRPLHAQCAQNQVAGGNGRVTTTFLQQRFQDIQKLLISIANCIAHRLDIHGCILWSQEHFFAVPSWASSPISCLLVYLVFLFGIDRLRSCLVDPVRHLVRWEQHKAAMLTNEVGGGKWPEKTFKLIVLQTNLCTSSPLYHKRATDEPIYFRMAL